MTAPNRHEQLGDPQSAQPLHAIETIELAQLLELVEQWLMHANWDVQDSLIRFAGYHFTNHPAAQLSELVHALGSYAIRLRTLPIEPTR